jgi:hypothetical protein
VPKLESKRTKYPKDRDPHNTGNNSPKLHKKCQNDKGLAKAKSKSQTSGKKGRSTASKLAPSKDSKEYRTLHRKQKEQRKKRKLRNWIMMAEKRRRIKISQEILQEQQFKGKRGMLTQ